MKDTEGLARLAAELKRLSEVVMAVRNDALFNGEDERDLQACPPLAEQHALLALSALETAARHFTLASYLTAQGQ